MTELTLDHLIQIMRECAGEDTDAALGADSAHVDFDELGYDSLAVMEAAARLERDLGIALPEEEIAEVRTLAAFVALANRRLTESAGLPG
ncbi:acyl carrier protein [Thermobifida alba]|uniref:Acyl carrier protein n=1 Tax=Thermobifida alba TaxID=53522 RepID=A0ABY4L0G5_THEAE|nr:acyl carrier protein [Thermobifida alba]UPT20829.1 acyl carrier protein [Thermobifida alba]